MKFRSTDMESQNKTGGYGCNIFGYWNAKNFEMLKILKC
jgi:hypothetical protein